MRISAKTETGRTRAENQDDYRAADMQNGICWAVVCDGMGGANGGGVASALAVAQAEKACMNFCRAAHTAEEQSVFLKELFRTANREIYTCARQQKEYSGMGTTMVAALVQGNICTLASVGDSRAYLLRGRQLRQITHDHSVVQRMIDDGLLNPHQAADYPYRNMITRAVGVQREVSADIFQFEIDPTDKIMLCTDGLTNAVSSEDICRCMLEKPFYGIAPFLINQVLLQQEQDNITVLLIDME